MVVDPRASSSAELVGRATIFPSGAQEPRARFNADLRKLCGGGAIDRSVAGKPVNFFQFFRCVLEQGGFEAVDAPSWRGIAERLNVDDAKWATLRTLYYVDLLAYQREFLDAVSKKAGVRHGDKRNNDNQSRRGLASPGNDAGKGSQLVETNNSSGARKSERTLGTTFSRLPNYSWSQLGNVTTAPAVDEQASNHSAPSPSSTQEWEKTIESNNAVIIQRTPLKEYATGNILPDREPLVDVDDSAWLSAMDQSCQLAERRRKRHPLFLFRNLKYMAPKSWKGLNGKWSVQKLDKTCEKLVVIIKSIIFEAPWSSQIGESPFSLDVSLKFQSNSFQDEEAAATTILSETCGSQAEARFEISPVLRRAATLKSRATSLQVVIRTSAGNALSAETSISLLDLTTMEWNSSVNSRSHSLTERSAGEQLGQVTIGSFSIDVEPPQEWRDQLSQMTSRAESAPDPIEIGYIFPKYLPLNRKVSGLRCAWCSRGFMTQEILEKHLVYHHSELRFKVKKGRRSNRVVILVDKEPNPPAEWPTLRRAKHIYIAPRPAVRLVADTPLEASQFDRIAREAREAQSHRGRARLQKLIQDGVLFHSGTWFPIKCYDDLEADSEDDMDTEWRTRVERELMNDFVDIHPRDLALMNMWNEYVDTKGRPLGWRDIPRALQEFVDEYAEGLSEIRLNLMNWAELLWRYGLLAKCSASKLLGRLSRITESNGCAFHADLSDFCILEDLVEKPQQRVDRKRRRLSGTSRQNRKRSTGRGSVSRGRGEYDTGGSGNDMGSGNSDEEYYWNKGRGVPPEQECAANRYRSS